MSVDIILLSNASSAAKLGAVIARVIPHANVTHVSTLEQLEAAAIQADTTSYLLSYSTHVIVPANLLGKFQSRAVNIHAASPEYPGRDPHHFAIYNDVTRYGATAHMMTAKVDEGAILDVEWFDVADGTTPSQLLAEANVAALVVAERILPRMVSGEMVSCGLVWGPRKTSRRDFLTLCEITPEMSIEEVKRRKRAVAVSGRDNLFVVLSGVRFTHKEY